jgi:hypothetical protein
MKNSLILILLFTVGLPELQAQTSNLILSGGWATVQPEDEDEATNGFKIGVQYEFEVADRWLIGGSLSFLSFKSESSGTSASTQSTYQTWPFTPYAKYRIGKSETIHGYVKGVAGMQISSLKREGQQTEIKDHDVGLAIGPGAGIVVPLSEKLFLVADYEFLYVTNSFYNDGIINQVSLGLGIRLY